MTEQKRGKRLAKYVPDYVVFDLETTGMSATDDAIIEISAVRVRNGEAAGTFSTLVNPGREIPPAATRVNGITDEMVAGAPDIGTALAEFLEFAGKDVLVGHNIHRFDLNFVNAAALEQFGRTVENDYIDTLYMARRCLPQLKNYKLVDIAAYFGVNRDGAHRALKDCEMNRKCFEEMAKLWDDAQVEVCPRCGGELVKRKGKFGEFFGCGNFPACRFTKNGK